MLNRDWSYSLKNGHVRQGVLALAAVWAAVCMACGSPEPTPPPSAAEEAPSATMTAVPPTPPARAEPTTQATPALPPLPTAGPARAGTPTAQPPPTAVAVAPGGTASFRSYRGPPILEERILVADIVARVRLHSVGLADVRHDDKGVECIFYPFLGWRLPLTDQGGESPTVTSGYYTEGVAYTFDVIEYLKGSGDDQLSALDSRWSRKQPACRERFDTEEEAMAAAAPELEQGRRDASIGGREAIIFLVANQRPEGSAYAYEFTHADLYYYQRRDPYLSSQPAWMPGAEESSGEPAHGEAAGGLVFRSVTPDTRATETAAPTTLAEQRTLVAEVVEDFTTGAAEHGERLYRDCLALKYYQVQLDRWGLEYRRKDYDMASGLAAGAEVIDPEIYGPNSGKTNPPIEYMGGRDAHLFNTDPDIYHTERPLPQGEYRFFYWSAPFPWMTICGADEFPEALKTASEKFVHVTAPEGVLHEAFFDPVVSGEAVGAGGGEGVLKPAAFTHNGSQTTIRRIAWESGRVVMTLEPHFALTGHHADFIALDGTVSLRLDFDDAEATSDDGPVLAWGVCAQPWRDGDLLMLRIRESEGNLTGATRDADCPTTATTTPSSDADEPATTTTTTLSSD